MASKFLLRRLVPILGSLFVAACGDFLEVTNPGLVEDEALNNPQAMPGLVNGMSGDLSFALGHAAWGTGLMADELRYAGAYDYNQLPAEGIQTPEFANPYWDEMHRARWTAETGIERLKSVLASGFDKDPLAARANLLAGFSNRLLGENMCFAVIDGGPQQPHTVHFERAEDQFTEALRIAQAVSNDALARAALAGRASVRAWLGEWDAAVQDAEQVPTPFVHNAIFSTNTERENNILVEETRVRYESTVWGTRWDKVLEDPRVPWDTAFDAGGKVARGRDGATPVYRQAKYMDLASPIPLATGTEMLLLRAEAALREGDADAAIRLINDMRGFYGLPEIAASTPDEAWVILKRERAAELWLEARRFWDLRRWNAEGKDAFLENRDKCIPISDKEMRTNPNLRG